MDQHRRQRRLYRHLRQPDRRRGAAAHQRADRHRADARPPAAPEPARRHRRGGRPRIGHAAGDGRAGRPRSRRPAADRAPTGPTTFSLAEEQIARCRTILRKLSSPDTIAAASLEETTLGELIEEIVTPHRLLDVAIDVESQGTAARADLPAQRRVDLRPPQHCRERGQLRRAAGPDQRLLDRLRSPGRHRRRRPRISAPSARTAWRTLHFHPRRGGAPAARTRAAGGLGLGLFIAKALLERSGAVLEIANLPAPGSGAVATIVWPIEKFEQGRLPLRQALES